MLVVGSLNEAIVWYEPQTRGLENGTKQYKTQIPAQGRNDNVFPIARECKVIPTVILANARIFLNNGKQIPGQARNDTVFLVVFQIPVDKFVV